MRKRKTEKNLANGESVDVTAAARNGDDDPGRWEGNSVVQGCAGTISLLSSAVTDDDVEAGIVTESEASPSKKIMLKNGVEDDIKTE